MLVPFAHPVSCHCLLLGVVAQSLKPAKLLGMCKRTQELPTMLGVVSQKCCVRFHAAVVVKLRQMNKSKKRAAGAAYCFCDALVAVDVVGSTFVDAFI